MDESFTVPTRKSSTLQFVDDQHLEESALLNEGSEFGATHVGTRSEQIFSWSRSNCTDTSSVMSGTMSEMSGSMSETLKIPCCCASKTHVTRNPRVHRRTVAVDLLQSYVTLALSMLFLLGSFSLCSSYDNLCQNVTWSGSLSCNCSVYSLNSSFCTNFTTDDEMLYSCQCGPDLRCNISISSSSNSSFIQANGSCEAMDDLCSLNTSACQNTSADPCHNVTCLNNGTCLATDWNTTNTNYTCHCQNGYTGVHCEENINECNVTLNLCQHNGTCVDTNGSYACNCTEGYVGHDCSQPNCSLVMCQNGGHCNINNNEWSCNCTSGYQGGHCESDVDECNTSTPCQNNGTCFNFKGSYNCTCQQGFLGNNCSRHDSCFTNPCQNNGTCSNVNNSYNCSCVTGFMGVNCSEIDHCSSKPCVHGDCFSTKNGYNCSCHSQYIGYQCNIVDPCSSNPCSNDGSCMPLLQNLNSSSENCTTPTECFVCHCPTNYTGNTCETLVSGPTPAPETPGPPVGLIVGLTVGLFALLVIIVAIILLVVILNKRKNLGTYHPSQQEMNNARLEINGGLKPPPEERLI